MVVRELIALLGIKTDEKSQKKAEGGMGKLLEGAKKLALAYAGLKSVQFAKDMIMDVAILADRFGKLSTTIGLTAQELQGLEHAGGMAGANMEQIEVALKTLQKTQVEASNGAANYTKLYKKMGVEIKNADGTMKGTSQLFAEMADGLNSLDSDAERTTVAMTLLGESGTKLMPMFKQGSARVREMMNEVSDLGATMDDKFIKSGERFLDQGRRMNLVFQSMKIAIARDFMPWVNKGAEAILKWWKVNKDWVRSNVVNTLKAFGRVFRAVGGTIQYVLGLFWDLWNSFSEGGKRLTAIIGIIGLIGKALQAGPIGKLILVGTLIAAIIEDFMVWREGGISVIGGLIKAMDEFLGMDTVSIFEEWGGAFMGVIRSMIETVMSGLHFWVDVWEVGFTQAVVNWWERFQNIWGDFGDVFKGPINKAVKFFKDTFSSLVDWFEKNVVHLIGKLLNKSLAGKAFELITGNSLVDTASRDTAYGKGAKTALGSGIRKGGGGGLNQNLNVNTTINASPGMSEEAVASIVTKGVQKAVEQQNRDAINAFVPQAATSGVG